MPEVAPVSPAASPADNNSGENFALTLVMKKIFEDALETRSQDNPANSLVNDQISMDMARTITGFGQ